MLAAPRQVAAWTELATRSRTNPHGCEPRLPATDYSGCCAYGERNRLVSAVPAVLSRPLARPLRVYLDLPPKLPKRVLEAYNAELHNIGCRPHGEHPLSADPALMSVLVDRLASWFGRVTVVAEYNQQERCHLNCRERGERKNWGRCVCSCQGRYHGNPEGEVDLSDWRMLDGEALVRDEITQVTRVVTVDQVPQTGGFRARRPGLCRVCSLSYPRGVFIRKFEDDPQWGHLVCATALPTRLSQRIDKLSEKPPYMGGPPADHAEP